MMENQWPALYMNAALETDFDSLGDRIEAAERSMAERTSFGGNVSVEELRELKDSWDSLQTLKKHQQASQQLSVVLHD
jgi:hypothetical protein